jgi:hypothetical protein
MGDQPVPEPRPTLRPIATEYEDIQTNAHSFSWVRTHDPCVGRAKTIQTLHCETAVIGSRSITVEPVNECR